MFSDGSSSSDDEKPSSPFDAVKAAVDAKAAREGKSIIQPVDLDDPLYKMTYATVGVTKKGQRKSRYIEKLVQSAEERRKENERVAERRLKKQLEESAVPGEERFVTKAYKKHLEQRDAEQFGEGKEKKSMVRQSHNEVLHMEGRQEVHPISKSSNANIAHSANNNNSKKATEATNATEKVPKKRKPKMAKKRGLRRNGPKEIEDYRRRYFERCAEGKTKTVKL